MNRSRLFHLFISILAAWAFAFPAFAQDAVASVTDPSDVEQEKQKCLDRCGLTIMICASEADVRNLCSGVPECKSLTENDVKRVAEYCANCRGADCHKPSAKPPAKKLGLSLEELCKQKRGVMITLVDQVGENKQVVKSHKECRFQEGLPDFIYLLTVDKAWHEADEQQIEDNIRALRPQMRQEKAPKPTVIPVDDREQVRHPFQISPIAKPVAPPEYLTPRHSGAEVSVSPDSGKASDTVSSGPNVHPVFGFEVKLNTGVHTTSDADSKTVWGVGPEIAWTPGISKNWRAFLAGGIGYAGSGADGQNQKYYSVSAGAQPRLNEFWHWAFGVMHERRHDQNEFLRTANYGGFLEPKLCLGFKTSAHRLCVGARLFLSAQQSQSSSNLAMSPTKFDVATNLVVGWSHLPTHP